MPISHEHNLIFIHIPKTAGTSIEKALDLQKESCLYKRGKYKNYPVCPQHLFLSEIIEEVPDAKTYIAFSVIRNPFDRFVSEFLYYNQTYWSKKYHNLKFEDFIDVALKLSPEERRYAFDGHLELQIDYLNYNIPTNVFKFEDLNQGKLEKWLLKNYNLNIKIPHENKNKNRLTYNHYYTTQSSIDKVSEFYAKDLEAFYYKF